MIAWFARNSVAANLLMITMILMGVVSFRTELTIETFPQSAPDTISVSVPLRGATPEDIELGVAVRIEEAVQDLEGVKEITSISREGATSVNIEIDEDYDPQDLLGDVKSRVDAINTFPAEAEKPVIRLAQHRWSVIDLALSGQLAASELRQLGDRVRDELLRIDGISYVNIGYSRNYEISIEISQDRLRDLNLTLKEIAQKIRGSSVDISAGNVRTEGGDVLIRSKGQAYHKDEFDLIVVKTNSDGSIIRLRDIATVNDAFEEDAMSTMLNGEPGIIIRVARVGSQGAIEVADKVKEYIEQKRPNLPLGVSIDYYDDDSEVLKSRLGTLLGNMWQGGILVVILLALFLRPAVAFWVLLGIPISFIGAMSFLSLMGVSINMMSLYGFILAVGLVVDDAIVTGESIFTTMSEKGSGVESAIEGTNKVAIPVTFGVLTTMAAFIPMMFMGGAMSRLMEPIPIVIISILMISLVESKFVLPAHLKNIRTRDASVKLGRFSAWQQGFARGFEEAIVRYYQPALEWATSRRYSVLAVFVGLVLLTLALISSGWVRFTFMPRIPAETVRANLTMPVGTPFEVTNSHITRMAAVAEQLREKYSDVDGNSSITHILAVAGSGGGRGAATHRGQIQIETLPVKERPVPLDSRQLTREWRELIGVIPGAENLTFRSELIRFGDPIDIQLSGSSFGTLDVVATKIKERLATYPDVFEISDSLNDGKQELRVELTEQGHVLGLTRAEIVSQVSAAFRGFEAQRIQRGKDDVRVIVRLPRAERSTANTLNELLISTPTGQQVPLAHVARVIPDRGPSTIRRVDQYRVLNINADFNKEKINAIALNKDLEIFIDELLLNYPGIAYQLKGEAEEQQETSNGLTLGLMVVLFVIYCLLALPLASYTQPLIVMSVIPFSIIGAVVGHLIMGHDMAMVSYMGLLALVGVVVNDSLVLVDHVNQSRANGRALEEAVVRSGVRRFRAVMLTSLTTFFGLLPMMFASSTQSLFIIPMAISLGWGIIFATGITLILVPCNMLIADDIARLYRRISGSEKPATETSTL
ncbi:MAG: multidrug efflux pump subunit AcrB [Halieaceae bacterium]|jgi:multidrug efflux pump subunit AcrB